MDWPYAIAIVPGSQACNSACFPTNLTGQFGPTGTGQRADSSASRNTTYHSRITNSCNALPHPRNAPIGRPMIRPYARSVRKTGLEGYAKLTMRGYAYAIHTTRNADMLAMQGR